MKKLCLLYFLLAIASKVFCQNIKDIQVIAIVASDAPAKSSLSYEALTQFFQSTVTTENGGGFTFKSTLFSTSKLFSYKNLDMSNYFTSPQGTFLRNFEYSFGVNKDKNGSYSLLTGGLKYAIINKRDKGMHNFFSDDDMLTRQLGSTNAQITKIYSDEIKATKLKDAKKGAQMELDFNTAVLKFTQSKNVTDLPKRVQDLRDSLLSTLITDLQNKYNVKLKELDSRSLLTLSINPGYHWNSKSLDSLNTTLQYVVGLNKTGKNPWFLDAQLSDILHHDTINSQGLARNQIRYFIGGNKVLANDKDSNPLFETEFAFDFTHLTNKILYANDVRNSPKIDVIFRLHLSKEFTLPVTLKYDLKTPNLFGFISLQWNLESTGTN